LTDSYQREQFEHLVLPHMDAAYNLARWLVRNPHDAEDVAQEAMTRALKFFGGFRGGDPRAWLLTIVRNSCFTWLGRNRAKDLAEFDEETHSPGANPIAVNSPGISTLGNQSSIQGPANPETMAVAQAESARVRRALEELPVIFREAVVMRELEGMSYKEIADVTNVSIGTVMSRLARGRDRLRAILVESIRTNPARQEEPIP
jgi:RNA polymerase sigma-70 factor (ECF subfamily)